MNRGTVAVALAQGQVTLVQAARSHSQRDRYIDVITYIPLDFEDRVFSATDVPSARIASSDLLTIFSPSDVAYMPTQGMLGLHKQAYSEYLVLSGDYQKKRERMWDALLASDSRHLQSPRACSLEWVKSMCTPNSAYRRISTH